LTTPTQQEQLRDNIARVLGVRRPIARRVVRWLRERLHGQLGTVHADAAVVPFRSGTVDVGVLVATVDYATLEVGCAWCGLFIASQGEALVEGTRAVQLDADDLPRELRELRLRPAVLYCAECWPELASFLRERYGVAEEVAS